MKELHFLLPAEVEMTEAALYYEACTAHVPIIGLINAHSQSDLRRGLYNSERKDSHQETL